MKINNTKVMLNCLAKNLENAQQIYKASQGDVFIGLLTSNFASDEEFIKIAKEWNKKLFNRVSIGLGAGNPNQAQMVQRVASKLNSFHINQVFTHVGQTTMSRKNKNAIVNALISPTGVTGKVVISTGPSSSLLKPAVVSARTALAMIKDMGGTSVKFFNMQGLKHFKEAKHLISLCKEFRFSFEPTGGITINDATTIISECIKQEVELVIIHIYSAIIDKKSKLTKIKDVQNFWDRIRNCKVNKAKFKYR